LREDLREFSGTTVLDPSMEYYLFKRALCASALRRSGDAEGVRKTETFCLDAIKALQEYELGRDSRTVATLRMYESLWWDLSDALALVGDSRLDVSAGPPELERHFIYVDEEELPVGCSQQPPRQDAAKPVLAYDPQTVRVGPLWVSKLLVTTEWFSRFWSSPDRDECFYATGRQWLQGDERLKRDIAEDFDLTSLRCFWKESSEQVNREDAESDVIALARSRALGETQIALWDSTQADERFSARGNPVVGVTWWEAQAYCVWWSRHVLPLFPFPKECTADLLTDWEWEALRRRFYDDTGGPGGDRFRNRMTAAHLRVGRGPQMRRPLHVGMYPVPAGVGPTDMIGNVWEWTRSVTFGRIERSSEADGVFGKTAWNHVDEHQEKLARASGRDETDRENDLRYRTTRGSSYFAIDLESAWNASYRLCDPPYMSFIDLGFRIAVYPSSGLN
jgi:formylglycine-generating enzyme required for sulfatase activity